MFLFHLYIYKVMIWYCYRYIKKKEIKKACSFSLLRYEQPLILMMLTKLSTFTLCLLRNVKKLLKPGCRSCPVHGYWESSSFLNYIHVMYIHTHTHTHLTRGDNTKYNCFSFFSIINLNVLLYCFIFTYVIIIICNWWVFSRLSSK